jgi:hypothetical protein
LLPEFHHQRSFPIPENNCHQLSARRNKETNSVALVLERTTPTERSPLVDEIIANFLLADISLNLFGLFGECACIHCFDRSLVSTFANKTQVSSPITRTT